MDWLDQTAERVIVVPMGECVLDGFADGRPLTPVHLQLRPEQDVVVDLAIEAVKEPWVVDLAGGGAKSGVLTAHGVAARMLDSAQVDTGGVARFLRVDPTVVESLRWIDAAESGWQKVVEGPPRSIAGSTCLRVEADTVTLKGMVALDKVGRIAIRVIGKDDTRTVSYRHSHLTANEAWSLRVEAGLRYELVWSLVDEREVGRTTVGGREELGLVRTGRSVVVR